MPDDVHSRFDDVEFVQKYKVAENMTGMYALKLMEQMGMRPEPRNGDIHVLDLACGTGACSEYVLDACIESGVDLSRVRFTGADFAPPMLDMFRKRVQAEKWMVKPEIVQMNMMDSKLPSDTFTHVICNFGPTLTPKPQVVLEDSYRVLKAGGIAGWTGWYNFGWMPDMTEAFDQLRSGAAIRIKEGKADVQDQALQHLPVMPSTGAFTAMMQGNDLDKAIAGGKEEGVPRWDLPAQLKAGVGAAGFTDVRVEVVSRDWNLRIADLDIVALPVLNVLKAVWWSSEQREAMKDIDLESKVRRFWSEKYANVEAGKIVWKDCNAILCTGRKV